MKTYAIFNDSFFKNKPWWMLRKLYNVVCQRSNPRSEEYMLSLLRDQFPDAQFITVDTPHESGRLILLYPDAIGLGWSSIEKKVVRRFESVKILNGRKRCFDLNVKSKIQLHLKRFLEITFIPEVIFAPILLICGVILAIKDKIRGS